MMRIPTICFLGRWSLIILLQATVAGAYQPPLAPSNINKPIQHHRLVSIQRSAFTATTTFEEGDLLSRIPHQQKDGVWLPFVIPPPLAVAQTAVTKSNVNVEEASVKVLLGEALGTFWIVGLGSMACSITTNPVMDALIWSMAVATAIYSVSATKGAWGDAHFNPAITVATAAVGRLDWYKVHAYILAQVVGSTLGSALAALVGGCDTIVHGSAIIMPQAVVGMNNQDHLAYDTVGHTSSSFMSFLSQTFTVEAIGAFCLSVLAFGLSHPSLQTSRDNQQPTWHIPAIMGATVFGLIQTLAPRANHGYVGINPARDLGPRLVEMVTLTPTTTASCFQDWWIFLAAPVLGACLGAILVEQVAGALSSSSPASFMPMPSATRTSDSSTRSYR